MEVVAQIVADLKAAMKARDEQGKAVLRSLKAALDKEAIDTGKDLDDQAVITVIKRAQKQRKEAAETYQAVGETDRANAELAEAEIIAKYLPAQLSADEVANHIDQVIADTGASSPADQGKVLGPLAKILAGQADMKEVAAQVRAKLGA